MTRMFLYYVIAVFLGQDYSHDHLHLYQQQSAGTVGAQSLIAVLLLLIGVWLFWGLWSSPENRLAGLVHAAVSLPVQLFPVGGWLGWSFAASIGLGPWWPGLLLCLVWFLGLVFLLTHFDRDWYEDVLRTAELAQSAMQPKRKAPWNLLPAKSASAPLA